MADETAMERHQRKIKAMHKREADAKARKSKKKEKVKAKKAVVKKAVKKVAKKKKKSGHEDVDKIKSGAERRTSAMELLKIEMKKQGM